MQHAILMSLEPAKRAYAQSLEDNVGKKGQFSYIGGADAENVFRHTREDGRVRLPPEGPVVRQGGEFFTLVDGLYDLRATLVYLALHMPPGKVPAARQNPERARGYQEIDPAFRNAFTRAARSLVERGLLFRHDDEGAPQLRFVSMPPSPPMLVGET
jgi:hypothetical protein